MHNYLPIAAAAACAICNGVAAVLQKISADKERRATSLDAHLLWRLFQDAPYIIGVILDIVGWVFTLYAVRFLPLFLVEAIIAANIAVTAVVERVFRSQRLQFHLYLAISMAMLGLVLIALGASPDRPEQVSSVLRWAIALSPLPLALAGYVVARRKSYRATAALAVLGGMAFGATSVMGRIYTLSQPVWHSIYSPLTVGILASGALGILLFSTSLQRTNATIVSGVMTASQTIAPSLVGILFLGDAARQGMWTLVVLGNVLTLGGVALLAFRRLPVRP